MSAAPRLRTFHSRRELQRFLIAAHSTEPPAVAVVIDVLRATTTLVHAFAHGARAARAFETAAAARAAARTLAPGTFLLCGEQGGLRIPGFDCGNSPGEYTAERVRARTLLVATTNGAPALVETGHARRQVLGAFVNLSAVVARVRRLAAQEAGEVWLVAAGKDGSPAPEDSLCVGAIASALVRAGFEPARPSSIDEAEALEPGALERFLRSTEHGSALLALDPAFAADVADAAQVDRFDVVPEAAGGGELTAAN